MSDPQKIDIVAELVLAYQERVNDMHGEPPTTEQAYAAVIRDLWTENQALKHKATEGK